jgi:hypothetical protein
MFLNLSIVSAANFLEQGQNIAESGLWLRVLSSISSFLLLKAGLQAGLKNPEEILCLILVHFSLFKSRLLVISRQNPGGR